MRALHPLYLLGLGLLVFRKQLMRKGALQIVRRLLLSHIESRGHMLAYLESPSEPEHTVIGFFGREAFQGQHNHIVLFWYEIIDAVRILSASIYLVMHVRFVIRGLSLVKHDIFQL